MAGRLLWALGLAVLPALGIPAGASEIGELTTVRLANGFTLVVARRPEVELLAVNLAVAVGSLHDPPGRSGMAHLLEHLSLTGSVTVGSLDPDAEAPALVRVDELATELALARSRGAAPERRARLAAELRAAAARARELAEPGEVYGRLLEAAGGIGLNAVTTADATQYFARLPASALATWLELEADRLRRPVFRRFLAERETVVREVMATTGGRPSLPELFVQSIVAGGPGSRSVFGDPDQLRRVHRPEALRFFRRSYRPERMSLVVVGEVEPGRVEELVRRHFGDLPAGGGEPPGGGLGDEVKAGWGEAGTVHVRRFADGRRPVVLLGFPAPAPVTPEAAALEALAEVLNTPALSPLHHRRVAGPLPVLAVRAVARYPSLGGPALFLLQIEGAPGAQLELLLEEAFDAIRRLPATGDEVLQAGILLASMRLARRLEDPASLAAALATHGAVFDDAGALERRWELVQDLTPADVVEAVSRRLVPLRGAPAPEAPLEAGEEGSP